MASSAAASHGSQGARLWRILVPLGIIALLALVPPPAGLPQHAWYYFAIFAGLIAALVTEPLPSPAIGLIGVTVVAILAPWVLFSPEELAKPDFDYAEAALKWAVSGFSSGSVWLVFGAFMFALGYGKTGLGKRVALYMVKAMGKTPLSLGYATTFTDALLAPVTPSNTARSAGTIFPIVANLPPIYGSLPNDPSARKVGGYIMWVTFAAGCVTSTLFMTACAPNFLAIEFAKKIANVDISYQQWMMASVPFALPLLLALPILTYFFYAPQVKEGSEVQTWAGNELTKMGSLSRNEQILSVLVLLAIILWVFGGHYVEGATAALIVVSLMLILGVLTWNDMARNHTAWTTLVLLATLVTLAGGLSKTGFIKWFATYVSTHMGGMSPMLTVMALVAVYFFSHYMFASLTAHTTAMFPVTLSVGMGIPDMHPDKLALALALTTGIMGVITPYATGPGLAYYESGYLPSGDFWRLATIFGFIFIAAHLFIGVPLLFLW